MTYWPEWMTRTIIGGAVLLAVMGTLTFLVWLPIPVLFVLGFLILAYFVGMMWRCR